MKRYLPLLLIFLSACSSVPMRSRPPVIDGHTGRPQQPVPERAPQAPVPAPPPAVNGGDAVVALLQQAEGYRRSGDINNQAATIERALRIDPNNATLWSRLAAVRFEQGQPAQAEQLALKSNTLARGDTALLARNWQLVARARWSANDAAGARVAEQKARDSGG